MRGLRRIVGVKCRDTWSRPGLTATDQQGKDLPAGFEQFLLLARTFRRRILRKLASGPLSPDTTSAVNAAADLVGRIQSVRCDCVHQIP